MSSHSDYRRMPEARRWGGKLAGLMPVITREARVNGGRWAWRILPRGAVVGVRLRVDGSTVLRIARRSAETGAAWERELAVFLRELGCEDWTPEENVSPAEHHAVALFVEPPPGKLAPAEPESLGLFGTEASKQKSAISEGR